MTKRRRSKHRANSARLARQLAIAADVTRPRRDRTKAARWAASIAERMGLIDRPTRCDWCRRRLPLERHHPEHSRPLEVIYLCRPCHDLGNAMHRESAG